VKILKNLLEISNLVDVKKMSFTIPFHFHAQEKMQIVKIFHFKLSKKTIPSLAKAYVYFYTPR